MLDVKEKITIGIFVFLMLSQFILMIVKAYFHFEYLKKVNPNKFERYSNFFEIFGFDKLVNFYRVTLLFPAIKIKSGIDTSKEVYNMIKRVKIYSKLIIINFLILLLFVGSLIVFFGDFS